LLLGRAAAATQQKSTCSSRRAIRSSHDKTENILVGQGFLTGSVRFQNEWADEVFRLSRRDDLDVSKL
jgi:hypothetical protein